MHQRAENKPRRKAASSSPEPAAEANRSTAAQPHVVNPNAVYSVASATAALGLKRTCLGREIRRRPVAAELNGAHHE